MIVHRRPGSWMPSFTGIGVGILLVGIPAFGLPALLLSLPAWAASR